MFQAMSINFLRNWKKKVRYTLDPQFVCVAKIKPVFVMAGMIRDTGRPRFADLKKTI